MAGTDYRQEMDEETARGIASLLRKPHGEYAIEVGEKMNEGNRVINQRTIEMIPISTNDHLLEIGMGNGLFVKDLFGENDSIQYTGCDYSEEMVDQSRLLNSELIDQGKVDFHMAEAAQLPFGHQHFDHIFSVNTIYFWDDHTEVLIEIKRVLKTNGTLTLALRPKANMKDFAFTQYGFDMFSKDDLTDLLEKNGFKVIAFLEEKEPEQEVDGLVRKVETLVITAKKNGNG